MDVISGEAISEAINASTRDSRPASVRADSSGSKARVRSMAEAGAVVRKARSLISCPVSRAERQAESSRIWRVPSQPAATRTAAISTMALTMMPMVA